MSTTSAVPSMPNSSNSSLQVKSSSSGTGQNGSSTSTGTRSTSSNGTSGGGSLSVTILSAYDLPAVEQPVSVTLSCLGQSVSTGAPSARHKDRNSFKFPNQPLVLNAPLAQLYNATATLTVNYRVIDKNVSATLQLQSLKIQQVTWLILNLAPDGGNTTTNNSANSTNSDDVPPTLRLQVELSGPYRPEIAALMSVGNAWFGFVDQTQGGINGLLQSLPPLPDKKYFLVPAVPLATALVVLSPIVIGVLVVGLPFLLPIVVVLLSTLIGLSGVFVATYFSTEDGRSYVANVLQPAVQMILSTTSGQRLVYETGPRPTPVSVARILLPKQLMGKLLVSLLIDLLGSSSYLLPFVGEGFDLAWAPIQTILIMAMYDAVSPNLKYISFLEEILPFTDVVPSATIGWLIEFGPPLILKTAAGGSAGAAANADAAVAILADKMQTHMSALANANTAALLNKSSRTT